jgi:hypothetical protein
LNFVSYRIIHQGFFKAVFGSDNRTHSQRQNGLYFPKIWTKFPNSILLKNNKLFFSKSKIII